MRRKRSRASLLQYILMGLLVVVLLALLYLRASPGVFTLVFLGGIIIAALPSILAGKDRSKSEEHPADQGRPGNSTQPSAPLVPMQTDQSAERDGAGSPWSIRPLRDEDLDEAAALLRLAFEEYRGFLDPPSGAHNESAEQLRLVLRDSRALVAVLDSPDSASPGEPEEGRIVGCVFYQFIIDHVYLFRLAVHPDYRRHGIARSLIEQVEDITRRADVHWVQLGVRIQLPKNQLYYEKQGYKVLRYEAHKDYPTPTVVILQKRV